jgi:hypothetical protein
VPDARDDRAGIVHNQTWEEMMFASCVYSIDAVAPGTVITPRPGGQQ